MQKTTNQERYTAIVSRIERGETSLYPRDVQFYLNYCNQNKITPVSVTEDPSATPIRADVGAMRYSHIIDRLHSGRSVEATEYQFLKRYCKKMGLPLPLVESRMQFWLKKEV